MAEAVSTRRLRAVLIWAALLISIVVPIVIAARSPLLAWREPIYIAAGLSGVLAMALLLLQPLLAAGYLPGLSMAKGRRLHRWVGCGLVTMIVLHVGGLWLTSPPDVVDALLFVSPTPFSAWGVVAMWAVFASALLALFRQRLRGRLRLWRLGHTSLALVIVVGSVVHAMLIEGTMGLVSKILLCALALAATTKAVVDLRAFASLRRTRT